MGDLKVYYYFNGELREKNIIVFLEISMLVCWIEYIRIIVFVLLVNVFRLECILKYGIEECIWINFLSLMDWVVILIDVYIFLNVFI